MATFEELMESLRNPGEDGPGETIYDDLQAAYTDRVTAGDAKVSEVTTALETANGELTRVKAHNYELLSAVSVGNPSTVSSQLEVQEVVEDVDVTSIDDIISFD